MVKIQDDQTKDDPTICRLRHIAPGGEFKLHDKIWRRCQTPICDVELCPNTERFWLELRKHYCLCFRMCDSRAALLHEDREVIMLKKQKGNT